MRRLGLGGSPETGCPQTSWPPAPGWTSWGLFPLCCSQAPHSACVGLTTRRKTGRGLFFLWSESEGCLLHRGGGGSPGTPMVPGETGGQDSGCSPGQWWGLSWAAVGPQLGGSGAFVRKLAQASVLLAPGPLLRPGARPSETAPLLSTCAPAHLRTCPPAVPPGQSPEHLGTCPSLSRLQ